MPLSAPAPRVHLHTRTVTCTGYLREDGLWDIEGRIVDVKTYAFDNDGRGRVEPGTPVHDMTIRLTIDDRLEIHAVEAATDGSPFQICPDVLPNFQRLVGVRIGPGFTRTAKEKVGGTRGCTHIVEMLGQVATVAFQTTLADRARALRKAQRDRGIRVPPPDAPPVPTMVGDGTAPKRRPMVIDTCHAWASDGPLVKEHLPAFYVDKASGR